MSIELTTQVLSIQDLTQSAKFLLTILCFRANQNHEVYSSIERLCLDCSCSINTLEKNLKVLRDKNYLMYTGKIAPKTKNIPIYKVNLNNPKNWGEKELTTPIENSNHPNLGNLTTPKIGIEKDNKYKDNKKDIDFSFEPTQLEKNEIKFFLKNGFKIPNELQSQYLWLKENNYL